MPTKPTSNPNETLTGLAAQLAGQPLAQTPRGGMESGFSGTTQGATNIGASASGTPQPTQDFTGLGPVLENDDAAVFKQTDGLVLRQELLALNHLAQDNYYTCVVSGYPWAELRHDTTKDLYTFALPYGTTATSIQAVPNKNLDLVNKASATVLADFPEADAEPVDDSEEANGAAEMANRFLAENASEQGTNDAVLFDDRLKRAMVTASTYIEGWVDPTGGGYVPLQIDAHPEATDPNKPLLGPDGMPTTDPVLRYVAGEVISGDTGTLQFAPGAQFTDDPAQAAPQWQPKIMATCWERTHLRVFPEDKPVHLAEKVIILGYCTISEGKRRWKDVAAMQPSDLNALCDWTPQRYLVLLPSFQRARWKTTDGREKEKAGASDERIFFYYHILQRATPDYPKGADVVVSGAMGGTVLSRELLANEVEVDKGQGKTKELRCREIPVVQITPRGDPNGRDPSGLSWLEQFVGATENTATLAMGFSENIDKTNHTPYAIASTSPIEGWQVDEARASGDFLILNNPTDEPKQIPTPTLATAAFAVMFEKADEATNSIANQERAAQGSENSQERSGKALQIAIGRNNVANTPLQTTVNNSVARWNRIKLELAMAYYTTPQMIRYEGEDGAFKQDEFVGTDFALVGKVSIKAGTGTMMPPSEKVNYLGNLRANQLLDDDETKDAARPVFAKQLGLTPNPHEQYIDRCIKTWLDGPPVSDPTDIDPTTGQPKPDWAAQYRAWQRAQDAYAQAQQVYQQQMTAFQQYQENKAIAAGGPPQPLGPEQQNAQAMDAYQRSVIALQTAAASGQALEQMPVAPQAPQVPKPWTPFEPRPNDTEPAVATRWVRKLSNTMSGVKYGAFRETAPEWTDVFNRAYTAARQAVALAQTAQAPAARPAPHGPQPTQPQQPQQPQRPQTAQPSGAHPEIPRGVAA